MASEEIYHSFNRYKSEKGDLIINFLTAVGSLLPEHGPIYKERSGGPHSSLEVAAYETEGVTLICGSKTTRHEKSFEVYDNLIIASGKKEKIDKIKKSDLIKRLRLAEVKIKRGPLEEKAESDEVPF